MKNIVVFYGGNSSEHDVSIITALQFIGSINESKYNVIPCYISRQNKFFIGKKLISFDSYRDFNLKGLNEVVFLPGSKTMHILKGRRLKPFANVDFAFNCCHGGMGEDGTLAGFVAMSDITLSCASHVSLGVTYDKVLTKKVAESSGIPVVPYIVISDEMWKNKRDLTTEMISAFGYPLVIKPARQGSSVGVSMAGNEEELLYAMRIALMYDNKILIERAVQNKREFNVSCIGSYYEPIVSEVEEVLSSGIMTFSDKYSGGKCGKLKANFSGDFDEKRMLPANITKKLSSEMKMIALKCYRIFELSGVVRFDFLMDDTKKEVYLSEINTIPGSMSSYFWDKLLIDETIMSSSTKLKEKQDGFKRDCDIKLI